MFAYSSSFYSCIYSFLIYIIENVDSVRLLGLAVEIILMALPPSIQNMCTATFNGIVNFIVFIAHRGHIINKI